MNKISEKLDLSKKVLDINIDSPVFEDMLENLDTEIQRVVKSVYENEFAEGEINLKLNLKIKTDTEEFATTDEYGDVVNETYRYRKPDFEHKVTTVMKKTYSQKGSYSPKREVIWDEKEEKYVAKPLINPQISFLEVEGK